MSPEPLGVDDVALRGFGTDLAIAAGDIPAAPAAFTVTGGDAISQKISSLLPAIEGPILSGLPQIKEEAGATANNVVASADLYKRTDEELAGLLREAADLLESGGSGGSGGVGGSGPGAEVGGGSGGGAGAAEGAASAAGGGTAAGGADPMSQMMGMPMQLASQAAQLPMQALGALAAVPQAILQGVQQVSQLAGGMGGDSEKVDEPSPEEKKPAEDEPKRDEVRAERPDTERAPVEPPVAQSDPNVAPQERSPEKPPPAQTRPADSRSL